MFSIAGGFRAWRICFCGLAVAGLLLGAPFTGNPGSQCQAKGKGGGHGGKGHGGHKARSKRHGPKRHHAGHHAAKKHRTGKRHAHSSHKSHSSFSHTTHGSSSHTSYFHHNAWDYYWGHHGYADGVEVVHDGTVVVNPAVNAVVAPSRVVEKYVFHNGAFVRYLPPGKSQWVESKTDGGPEFRFAEVSRDKDWIRLFDSSRNMSLRLPVPGGMAFASRDKGQTWKTLRKVEKVNVGGPEYPDSSK